jgi:DNA-binding NarL/FixJ family response regulator
MNRPTQIWILDDHPLVLQATRTVVEQAAPNAEVLTFCSIKELLIHARGQANPLLFILDWHLPDGSALELLQKFDTAAQNSAAQSSHAPTRFLILTGAEPLSIEPALSRLRHIRPTIITKNQTTHVLTQSIKSLLPMQSAQQVNLTPRQQNLMELVELGMKNIQIASKLCISEHTVKAHLSEIFKKLNVQSRTQAIHKWKSIP